MSWSSGDQEQLVVKDFKQAKMNGRHVNAARVNFTNGEHAFASAKLFDGDDPLFTDSKDNLKKGYVVANIQGVPWVVNERERGTIE